MAESGTLNPADCLSREAVLRLEARRAQGEAIAITWPDGTSEKGSLVRSAMGLQGRVVVSPHETLEAFGIDHADLRGLAVNETTLYTPTGPPKRKA